MYLSTAKQIFDKNTDLAKDRTVVSELRQVPPVSVQRPVKKNGQLLNLDLVAETGAQQLQQSTKALLAARRYRSTQRGQIATPRD